MTKKRFRVINYSDGSGMYGVSDRIAEITVAWDKSKLIMDNLCDLLNELYEENQIKLEIVDAFILGMEDEKGIAPEDKEFQCRMNHTIKVLKRLKEDMLNPTDFKRLKEENEYLEGNVNE